MTAALVASVLVSGAPAAAAQTIGFPTFSGPAVPQPPVGYSTGNMMQTIYNAESGGTDFWMDRLLARPGNDPAGTWLMTRGRGLFMKTHNPGTLGFGGQVDAFYATVAGLGAAFDPAIGHEPVDHAAGGRLFDFHHLGELGMRRPGPAMQAGQHEPLATGDPEPAHTAIEFRPQQAGDVRDHDTNVFFGIWHGGPL